LNTCYDPEIPVNIVDLGLVYDCVVDQPEGEPAKVQVKMTLTAPGCGMGPVIAREAEQKIMAIPGVADAQVEVVWDPAWNQSMISEVGKMKLGLI
jgi:metal-sulfur cluster biosynthetic enzyme